MEPDPDFRSSSRGLVWVALGVAVASIGGWLVLRGDDAAPPAPTPVVQAAPPAAKPEPMPAPTPAPTPAPVASEAASAATPTPAASASAAEPAPVASGDVIRVTVTSVPPKARFYHFGKEIGTAPFVLELKPGERHAYEAGLPGFGTRKVVIDGSKPEVSVGLRKNP